MPSLRKRSVLSRKSLRKEAKRQQEKIQEFASICLLLSFFMIDVTVEHHTLMLAYLAMNERHNGNWSRFNEDQYAELLFIIGQRQRELSAELTADIGQIGREE